jgi:hypothetical protein
MRNQTAFALCEEAYEKETTSDSSKLSEDAISGR